MSREGFYRIIIIALLLLNLGTLGYLWTAQSHAPQWAGEDRRPPGGRHNPMDRLIISRLKLDDSQVPKFEELKHDHHSRMMVLQEEAARLHDKYFSLLKADHEDTAARNELMQQLSENNRIRESLNFEHFRDLKGILHPDQQSLFDSFVEELGREFSTRPGRRPPPPEE